MSVWDSQLLPDESGITWNIALPTGFGPTMYLEQEEHFVRHLLSDYQR